MLLWFLAQAQAVAGATIEFPSWLTPSLIIGALLWLIGVQYKMRDDVRMIKQWVFGITGTNGANSKIDKLRDDVDSLQSAPIGDLAKMLRYDGAENREADDRRAEDRVLIWLRDLAQRANKESGTAGPA